MHRWTRRLYVQHHRVVCLKPTRLLHLLSSNSKVLRILVQYLRPRPKRRHRMLPHILTLTLILMLNPMHTLTRNNIRHNIILKLTLIRIRTRILIYKFTPQSRLRKCTTSLMTTRVVPSAKSRSTRSKTSKPGESVMDDQPPMIPRVEHCGNDPRMGTWSI